MKLSKVITSSIYTYAAHSHKIKHPLISAAKLHMFHMQSKHNEVTVLLVAKFTDLFTFLELDATPCQMVTCLPGHLSWPKML